MLRRTPRSRSPVTSQLAKRCFVRISGGFPGTVECPSGPATSRCQTSVVTVATATSRGRMTTVSTTEGLYDSRFEHDACGVAFVADLRRPASHEIIDLSLTALENLGHRGAFGADPDTGDGAGILIQ